MRHDSKITCECGGMPDYLFTTEDEEQLYEYFKCKICGDIVRVVFNKN